MPKLKTHKGAQKRFRKTPTGKILRRHAYGRHLLTSKSAGRKRRLRQEVELSPGDAARVEKMLPYA